MYERAEKASKGSAPGTKSPEGAERSQAFFRPSSGERREVHERLIRGIYVPDRLPERITQAVSQSRNGLRLLAAENVARRSHESVPTDQAREFAQFPAGTKRREVYLKLAKVLQEAERLALERWARENGLLLDRATFDRDWEPQGKLGESEHEVYFNEPTQRWWKRNSLTFHNNALEYLQRIALHNYLFGETEQGPGVALRFEGFMRLDNGLIAPVVSQPTVRGRGATSKEVSDLLAARLGFIEEKDAVGKTKRFVLEPMGLSVEDLHNENALVDENEIVQVIDPVIYLNQDSKLRRLRDFADEESESLTLRARSKLSQPGRPRGI